MEKCREVTELQSMYVAQFKLTHTCLIYMGNNYNIYYYAKQATDLLDSEKCDNLSSQAFAMLAMLNATGNCSKQWQVGNLQISKGVKYAYT